MSLCLSSATAAWIAAVIVAIRAAFAAGVRSKVARIFLSKDFLRRFYRLDGAISCHLHGAPLGIIAGRSALVALWIAKAAGRGPPICVGMFEPRAVPVVINMYVRNAVPVPMTPVVLPVNVVRAPPAAPSDELDR